MTQDPLQQPLLLGLNKSDVFICKCMNGGKALNLFPLKHSIRGYT